VSAVADGALRLALVENVAALGAEEELQRDHFPPLGNKEIYRLTLLATGDAEAAEEARVKAIEKELERGETPAY
jgi:hypothetical protein